VHFRNVEHDGQRLRELVLDPRSLPLDLFVAGSHELPAGLSLNSGSLRGTSLLHYAALH
jgi:hypothetical protein